MRFIIEFIYRLLLTATYRDKSLFRHDAEVIEQGHTNLLNRREPLA